MLTHRSERDRVECHAVKVQPLNSNIFLVFLKDYMFWPKIILVSAFSAQILVGESLDTRRNLNFDTFTSENLC